LLLRPLPVGCPAVRNGGLLEKKNAVRPADAGVTAAQGRLARPFPAIVDGAGGPKIWVWPQPPSMGEATVGLGEALGEVDTVVVGVTDGSPVGDGARPPDASVGAPDVGGAVVVHAAVKSTTSAAPAAALTVPRHRRSAMYRPYAADVESVPRR
jgi:hypothetical protein